MKHWRLIGNMTYWSLWPMMYVYLRTTRRSRVLIEAEGKVLVVKGWLSGGKWSLPGGGIHKRENAVLGAIREVKEETGIELPPRFVRHFGHKKVTIDGLTFTTERFKAELAHTVKPKIDHVEIIQAAWVDPHKLNKKNAYADVLDLIEV